MIFFVKQRIIKPLWMRKIKLKQLVFKLFAKSRKSPRSDAVQKVVN